ncbi:MAG: hypothetical protein KC457_25880, partial [Myxococcales bacterium]|nr:hypothetical protein [Myxococcales bacterium]
MSRPRSVWLAVVAAVTITAALGVVHAAPPQPGLPSPGEDEGALPGLEEDGTGETGEGPLDPDLLEQQRALAFADHLGRARRAAQQRRFAEAIAEYSSALDIHDGDPEALRGRAHAHHGATPRGRCPRLAIEDLALLQVYDPRGLWLSERATAMKWMGECGDAYAEERLGLAEELAALELDDPARPDDVRVVAAQLNAAEAEVARSDAQQRRQLEAAIAQLEAYRDECVQRGVVPV